MVHLMLIIIKHYIAAHYFSFQNRYHQVEPFTPLWGNCYKFPLRRGAAIGETYDPSSLWREITSSLPPEMEKNWNIFYFPPFSFRNSIYSPSTSNTLCCSPVYQLFLRNTIYFCCISITIKHRKGIGTEKVHWKKVKKVNKSSWPYRRNRLQSTFPRQLTRQECPPYNGGICGTAQDLYS